VVLVLLDDGLADSFDREVLLETHRAIQSGPEHFSHPAFTDAFNQFVSA